MSSLPPHRRIDLAGLHAYADRESVYPGERIKFYVSSHTPYDIEIRRLGTVVGDRGSDTIVATQAQPRPMQQPVYPGSYIHAIGLQPGFVVNQITIECWVRPTVAGAWTGLVTQHDYPSACSFGLFLDPTLTPYFYLGDGAAWQQAGDCAARLCLTPGTWHHVVGTWDGRTRCLYVDGQRSAANGFTGYVAGGVSPIRLGAYGNNGVADQFLDGDLAMPVIYTEALTASEVLGRFNDRGRTPPARPAFGCWPLDHREGVLAPDISDDARHGTMINNGTWNIGGPSFAEAKVTQFSAYDPYADPDRGSSVRFARDDLHDCGWTATDTVVIPANARPGLYGARFRGASGETWVSFVVRAPRTRPRPRVVVLANTHTWRAYNTNPFGGEGGDVPQHSCYAPHRGGQPGFQLGLRIPLPAAAPDTIAYGAGYHHLVRAEHFTHAWLEAQRYDYDVIADSDLDREGQRALAGASLLVLAGHAEYWTTRMFDTVDAWLTSGGCLMSLTGNAAWWTVAYDRDRSILECRKVGPGLGTSTDRWGESWHAADGQRGGLLRDRGRSWSSLSGLMFLAYTEAASSADFAPYTVVDGAHPLFHQPLETGLRAGDKLGTGTLAAVGHEYDVTIATLLPLRQAPVPYGAAEPTPEPGIEVLATSTLPCSRAFDYFGQILHTTDGQERGATSQGGELIYWERPRGGRVFNAGSVNAGSALWSDPAFAALVANALARFGIVSAGNEPPDNMP
ncbi:LamG domain-containing protein [Sorangium sp. So ce327]|uniref:N,N-dimethylformamidase beta subunit family domain-containing protein n=1 Tax=Sorangium sp. So ce327 TaxID=3133301 RepID=UPI003F5F1672